MSKVNRMLARLFRPNDSLPIVPCMHPYNFLLQLQPVLQHGRRAGGDSDPHVITEVSLVSYLMGMGFDYKTARAIVDSWESDESLLSDGVLED